jgi:glycosyltransferase involved in cell wall biosynthesis
LLRSQVWHPFSRLIIKSDGADWTLSSIANEMSFLCNKIGIDVVDERYVYNSKRQCVYYTSKYEALLSWKEPSHRIAFPYYHGEPSSSHQNKEMFENIRRHHNKIDRIQVSYSNMEKLILDTGIDEKKVFRIPISLNLDLFQFTNSEKKENIRDQLGIPQSAVVVGSFQKDGIGMDEGMEPKLIKGPDIFLSVMEILKTEIPELFVVLTAPARGYVKAGLENLGIPYKHFRLDHYTKVGDYFHALDLYIIPSRDEGGPTSLLESMASGIPLVTTRVGQAIDLIKHGENGWMVDVEDAEGLAHWSKYVIEHTGSIDNVLKKGRETAEKNCYEAQISLWTSFMRGFVSFD